MYLFNLDIPNWNIKILIFLLNIKKQNYKIVIKKSLLSLNLLDSNHYKKLRNRYLY